MEYLHRKSYLLVSVILLLLYISHSVQGERRPQKRYNNVGMDTDVDNGLNFQTKRRQLGLTTPRGVPSNSPIEEPEPAAHSKQFRKSVAFSKIMQKKEAIMSKLSKVERNQQALVNEVKSVSESRKEMVWNEKSIEYVEKDGHPKLSAEQDKKQKHTPNNDDNEQRYKRPSQRSKPFPGQDSGKGESPNPGIDEGQNKTFNSRLPQRKYTPNDEDNTRRNKRPSRRRNLSSEPESRNGEAQYRLPPVEQNPISNSGFPRRKNRLYDANEVESSHKTATKVEENMTKLDNKVVLNQKSKSRRPQQSDWERKSEFDYVYKDGITENTYNSNYDKETIRYKRPSRRGNPRDSRNGEAQYRLPPNLDKENTYISDRPKSRYQPNEDEDNKRPRNLYGSRNYIRGPNSGNGGSQKRQRVM